MVVKLCFKCVLDMKYVRILNTDFRKRFLFHIIELVTQKENIDWNRNTLPHYPFHRFLLSTKIELFVKGIATKNNLVFTIFTQILAFISISCCTLKEMKKGVTLKQFYVTKPNPQNLRDKEQCDSTYRVITVSPISFLAAISKNLLRSRQDECMSYIMSNTLCTRSTLCCTSAHNITSFSYCKIDALIPGQTSILWARTSIFFFRLK